MALMTRTARRLSAATALATAVLAIAACSGPSAGSATSTASASSAPSSSATSSASATASGSASASASASSSVGAIAAGFPSKTLPLMPGSSALSTSFDASTTPATASLVASSSTSDAAQMLDYYTKVLTDEGFAAVPAASAGSKQDKGATASASNAIAAAGTLVRDFIRSNGSESANITVVTANGQAVATTSVSVAPSSLK